MQDPRGEPQGGGLPAQGDRMRGADRQGAGPPPGASWFLRLEQQWVKLAHDFQRIADINGERGVGGLSR